MVLDRVESYVCPLPTVQWLIPPNRILEDLLNGGNGNGTVD